MQLFVCAQVGRNGAAICYSYSCSRGAYAGVSIDGSLLTARNDVNLDFYGGGQALFRYSNISRSAARGHALQWIFLTSWSAVSGQCHAKLPSIL
jgi:hypothetical protein